MKWKKATSSVLNTADGLRDVLTANGKDILDVTFFTDEPLIHLSSYVNSQNGRVWSAANPHEIKDTPFHDQKVGVWCAISWNRIIGPIFLDDTINSERYCEVILYPFIGHLLRTKLPAVTSNRTVLLHTQPCFHDATARCVREQNNFKGHLATTVAWLLSAGSNERHSLPMPSSRSPLFEGSHRKFHPEHPPTKLSRVLTNRRAAACLEACAEHFHHLL
jgi:hypothetical protein